MATVKGHGSERGQRKGAIDGGKIWWVAPTFPMASDIWRDLKKACEGAAVEKSEMERRIALPGGGSVTVKSADNANALRGAGLDGLVMDECAFVEADVWQRVLRPTLSDKKGWALFITTPNGLTSWFHDLFQQASGDDEWARWQRPTSDNPLIPAAELDAAKRNMPAHEFAQEYEAQFVSVKGAEFPADYFGDHLYVDELPIHHRGKVMALDPSKGKSDKTGDYSAFVTACITDHGLVFVDADLERRPAEQIVSDGVALWKEHGPDALAIEVNAWQDLLASMMRRRFEECGLILPPVWEIDNRLKKEVRIRTIEPLLRQRRLRFKRSAGSEMLINQLREFPIGKHDDGPDALEMALRTLGNLMGGREPEQVAGTVYQE